MPSEVWGCECPKNSEISDITKTCECIHPFVNYQPTSVICEEPIVPECGEGYYL